LAARKYSEGNYVCSICYLSEADVMSDHENRDTFLAFVTGGAFSTAVAIGICAFAIWLDRAMGVML
jgi:hypothetical protein